jgi:hypothetical protein
MGDDDRGIRSEGANSLAIDFMAGCHFVSDAMKFYCCFGDRSAGFVQRTERIKDGPNGAVWMIGKLHHAELDHLVGGGIQPGGLDVE